MVNNTIILSALQNQPFGLNSLGETICEARGIWIYHALQTLREKALSPAADLEKLISQLQNALPPAYAATVDEDFLLKPFNGYSAEFAFALAAICRQLAGEEHTKETTEKITLISPEEAFPLDFMDSFGLSFIESGLLGAKIVLRNWKIYNAGIF